MPPQDDNLELLEKSDYLTETAKQLIKARVELWAECELDLEKRAAVLYLCKHGTPEIPGYLYFLTFFGVIYEERNPPGFQKLPFVPYPYQIEELAVIHECVQKGVGVTGDKITEVWLKSRDMGLTWLVLAYFLWDWLFNQGVFHVGSRNEKEVDYLDEAGTLYFKLRYLLYGLPQWMRDALCPDLVDKKLLLSYQDGQVVISGESANPNFGTGKRRKAILMDEISKWEHDREAYRSASQVTNCLFLVGTPKGYGNFYSEICRGKAKIKADIRRVHWTRHPLKTKDLEEVDGKPTSSWYRGQCSQMTDDMIAGELDLSFDSSQKGLIFASLYGARHQKKGLKPLLGLPLIRSWDLGGWACVLFFQIDKWGRVYILKELLTEGLNLSQIADEVVKITEELTRKARIGLKQVVDIRDMDREDCGDPAGASMTKTNQEVPEYTSLWNSHQIMVEYMFMAHMDPKIRVRARIVAIQERMKKYIIDPNPDLDGPAFWVDVDECPMLDEALRGGYRYKLNTADNTVTDIIHEVHPYEDVIDALGYGLIYKFGVPESVRREAGPKKSEEQLEDEDRSDDVRVLRRTRC